MTLEHPSQPRHPANQLAKVHAEWGGDKDLWVFGYASLIWRPEFKAAEQRPATVFGWHRALEMRSNVNRGTPDCPGRRLACGAHHKSVRASPAAPGSG